MDDFMPKFRDLWHIHLAFAGTTLLAALHLAGCVRSSDWPGAVHYAAIAALPAVVGRTLVGVERWIEGG